MSNYLAASDETTKLFKDRITTKHLDSITWSVLSNNTLKMSVDNMCGKTIINSQVARARYDEDVIFIINEDVFDRLTELQQIITIDKLLADIEYDMDADTVKKKQKDIQEHSGILMTYRFEEDLQVLSSEIQRIYTEIKEEKTRSDGKEEK